MDGDLAPRIFYLGLLLAALAGWVFVEYRQRLGLALRTAAAWAMIIIGLAAGYGLWDDIRGDSVPRQFASESSTKGASEMTLRRAADGHFYAALQIDGTEVFFMVDTGATNMVLSRRDAERLGLAPEGLRYMGEASTANGVVRTARVTLGTIEFGPFRDSGFAAYVNQGPMEGSLLGMDYLRRFSIRIEDTEMILSRQP